MQKNNIIISENEFKTFHLTTTKFCGNMKNADERNSFCKSSFLSCSYHLLCLLLRLNDLVAPLVELWVFHL